MLRDLQLQQHAADEVALPLRIMHGVLRDISARLLLDAAHVAAMALTQPGSRWAGHAKVEEARVLRPGFRVLYWLTTAVVPLSDAAGGALSAHEPHLWACLWCCVVQHGSSKASALVMCRIARACHRLAACRHGPCCRQTLLLGPRATRAGPPIDPSCSPAATPAGSTDQPVAVEFGLNRQGLVQVLHWPRLLYLDTRDTVSLSLDPHKVDVEQVLLKAAAVQSRNQLALITRSVNSMLLKHGIGAFCQLRWMAGPLGAPQLGEGEPTGAVRTALPVGASGQWVPAGSAACRSSDECECG
jgi:hypothetical protein